MNKFITLANQANRLVTKRGSKLVVSAALVLFGATLMWPQPASAMKASDLYGVAPVGIADLIAGHCNDDGWHVVQDEWISPTGKPTATSTTVNYGAASVSLQLNWITYRCKSATLSTIAGHFLIDDTDPSIAALINVVGNLPYVATTATGYKVGVTKTFNYDGPFTAKSTIKLVLKTRGTITKKTGKTTSYICAAVAAGEPEVATKDATTFDPQDGYCKQDSTTFSILVNVTPPANLDGVKMDDSKVGVYGGNSTNAAFKDLPVIVSDVDTDTGNPFYFNASGLGAGPISVGSAGTKRTVSVDTAALGGGWFVKGYSLCDSTDKDCTTANVAYGAKYFIATAASSFKITFMPGVTYHIRWIFAPNIATCQPPTVSPSLPEDGELFSMTAYMSTTMKVLLADKLSVQIKNSAGTVSYYGPTNQIITATPTSPSTIASGLFTPLAGGLPFGTYTITTTLTGTDVLGSPVSCTVPINIIKKPYVHFFGLDVSAGGSFATGYNKCLGLPTPPPYGIDAFVKGVGPLVRGSAVQYGALATGQISASGFGSASLRTTLPTSKDGLTFANNPPPPVALGKLGTSHCVPDYFNTKPATLIKSTSDVNLASFDGIGDKTPQQSWYGRSPGTNISGFVGVGAGIAKDNRIAIYITGDAYITDDIKFKQTSWATTDDVPSFYLIATGNIYISPNVSQLDGVYVAQGSAINTGTINTCAPGFGAYPAATLNNNCNSQLTVNGAFVAKKVNLYRTFASLINSQGGERPLGPGDCTVNASMVMRSGDYDCAAEVFNFSPETFLGQPALGSAPGSGITKYDFITSLSPVL